MNGNADITIKNITLPGAEWGRIERQLAAAEKLARLCEHVRLRSPDQAIQLYHAIADYDDAKGE